MKYRDESMPVTPAQMRVRRRVYKQITVEPETLDMGDWEMQYDDLEERGCYTTRCIGGWAQFFAKGYVDSKTVEQDAVDAMGLSYADAMGVGARYSSLFYTDAEAAVRRMRKLVVA